MSYHSLSRAITTNHALSLVILSYHPSYNQDFSELWNHHTPSNLSFDNVIPYPVLSRQILPYHFLSLVITNLITKIFFRTLKSPHPFEFILWCRHSLSRAITTNPALSLVILSYHPSYNQDFSEVWNHPTPSNLSFDNVIPYPVLSRQILPYHFLSLVITNLITKIFFRTLKSPHPFEFILWWHHSLSRAITPNPALSTSSP